MVTVRPPGSDQSRTFYQPRNGRFFVALLVGGPADVARELRERLAEKRPILIKYHWEYKRPKSFQKPLPQDVDLAIMLKDMMGHSDHDAAVRKLKAGAVPFIRTQRKWGSMARALLQHGIAADNLPTYALQCGLHPIGEDVVDTVQVVQPTVVKPDPVVVVSPALMQQPPPTIMAPPPDTKDQLVLYALALRSTMRTHGVKSVLVTAEEIQMQFWEDKPTD